MIANNSAERSLLLFMKVLDLTTNPDTFHTIIKDSKILEKKDPTTDPYQKLWNELNKLIKMSLCALNAEFLCRDVII